MATNGLYFQYWHDKTPAKQWRWHLRAGNNEIIAQGEAYKNEQDCLYAISLVKASYDAPVHKSTLS
jgi:uncharacterized protein YegP (UPF0339 family)